MSLRTLLILIVAAAGLAAFPARAQPYAPPPSNLLFAQAQAPQDAPTVKAKKAAKAKKKSDAGKKAAAKTKKGAAKKATKQKAATKKTAP